MMGGDSIRLEHATIKQKEMSVALEMKKDMIAAVAAETAHDILDRFAREENGIFALQKRMELPPSARNKDFLTRHSACSPYYSIRISYPISFTAQTKHGNGGIHRLAARQ